MGGDSEDANHSEMMQRLHSCSSSFLKQGGNRSMEQLNIPQFNASQMRGRHHFHNQGLGGGGEGNNNNNNNSKRAGMPPSHPNQILPISPYSQIPVSRSQMGGSSSSSPAPTHSRSLSQPSSFFNLDSLPPLSPSPFRDSSSTSMSDPASGDVSMEDRCDVSSHSLLPPTSPFARGVAVNNHSNHRVGESLPPRKAHRRSNSDIPFGFSTVLQSSPPLIPLRGSVLNREPALLVKKESAWERGGVDHNVEGSGEKKSPEGEVVDDLFSAYMNLDNIDVLNNNMDEKNCAENRDDLDSSRASGNKTGGESSDNEAESSVNESGDSMQRQREGVKRSAGGDVAPTSRHYRSVSMDSFIGKLNFNDDASKLPHSSGLISPGSGVDGNSAAFSLEFGNGEFSGPELKKIMANEKLAEIAMADPKRAKRILANRQSAARSKERKMRYISELEHKVQTLQTEATTLSAQLTLLQRDSVGLTNQNSELKFRLQSMEQQAKLRDALNEALTAEVQRLKLATAELNGESHPSSCLIPQHSVNPLMFQQQQQQQQQNIHLQQQQQQNGNAISKTDLKQ
ncbi:bZIP transcription factor 29-like [Lotus japonicus]|uniref:bZIP transcription factor 29-like n=1 Tax=Lotus japonicus TaxID=34305 RepID=UPI00258932DF|nr:bZIP transcription factor 29-like [Lotus japonicus]XP_057456511.1 bZIP transcription factor 29-like [Lotus japonicus]